MKVHKRGCDILVVMSPAGVDKFANNWPCSGLTRGRGIWFRFGNNGDLLDTNAELQHPNAYGSGALVALADDARETAGL